MKKQKEVIEVRRDEDGNWWRKDYRGLENTVYTGEDAAILDMLLLKPKGNKHDKRNDDVLDNAPDSIE